MQNVHVKTTGWSMTDEISTYLDEKLSAIEKLVHDPENQTLRCDVELAHDRDQHASVARAEMNLFVNGMLYRAQARGATMQAALDGVKDEMQQQLRTSKQKHGSLLRRGGTRLKSWLRFGRE